jgi:hypothetical protein
MLGLVMCVRCERVVRATLNRLFALIRSTRCATKTWAQLGFREVGAEAHSLSQPGDASVDRTETSWLACTSRSSATVIGAPIDVLEAQLGGQLVGVTSKIVMPR